MQLSVNRIRNMGDLSRYYNRRFLLGILGAIHTAYATPHSRERVEQAIMAGRFGTVDWVAFTVAVAEEISMVSEYDSGNSTIVSHKVYELAAAAYEAILNHEAELYNNLLIGDRDYLQFGRRTGINANNSANNSADHILWASSSNIESNDLYEQASPKIVTATELAWPVVAAVITHPAVIREPFLFVGADDRTMLRMMAEHNPHNIGEYKRTINAGGIINARRNNEKIDTLTTVMTLVAASVLWIICYNI